jgi:hypothetical protein
VEWRETLRYFRWKHHSNSSDRAYEELRIELRISGIHIKSLRATRRFLKSCLGVYTTDYHRCVKNCMVYIGANLLRRRCLHCGIERFHENLSPDIDKFPDTESYSHLTPKAVYTYMPIIPRLKLLYAHPDSAAQMKYPQELSETWDGRRDVWDGNAMKYWKALGTAYVVLVLIRQVISAMNERLRYIFQLMEFSYLAIRNTKFGLSLF